MLHEAGSAATLPRAAACPPAAGDARGGAAGAKGAVGADEPLDELGAIMAEIEEEAAKIELEDLISAADA